VALFDAKRFAQDEFGRARLGHKSRLARLLKIGAQLAVDPEASIPQAFPDDAQAKAVYRFANSKHVSHAAICQGYFDATAQRSRGVGRLFVIQDTTHLSFGGRRQSDLGPVDTDGNVRGFLAHSALAVDGSSKRPLGLLGQSVWVRPTEPRPKNESSRDRLKRARESEKWSNTARQVDSTLCGLKGEKPHVVEIFDAEGDVFEALETLDALGHGFIIRACKNRLLEGEDEEPLYTAEAAATAPRRGFMDVELPSRPQRPARTARLELRSTTITIRPPNSRKHRGDPLEVSLVMAVELEPPSDEDRICWLLLTREPCQTRKDIERLVRDYTVRWLVEEFHMGLKTGCSLEERQLQTFHGLANLLALCNPIAVQLLLLRYVARADKAAPAETVLNPVQLVALHRLRPKLQLGCTAYEALRAIAGLGGFLGRKSDGEPGWRTLWRGFRALLLAERVLLADQGSG
jgi:hypothetical protein